MNLFSMKSSKSVLSHHIEALPKQGRGEISRIAAHLKVSTTLVSHVLSGQKILTVEQAESVSSYLGFGSLESDYFVYLVQLERAGTRSLREFWQRKLTKIRDESTRLSNRVDVDKRLSEVERSIFYSTPLYSAIHLFTTVGDEGKTLDEICERFDLPRPRAASMLAFLTETGICVLREARYLPGLQKTHVEQDSPHLQKHHANWRIRAIRQAEELTKEELMYTAPVSLSRDDFEELREEMAQFIKKFLNRVHASPAEDVACFTMDWFWIRK